MQLFLSFLFFFFCRIIALQCCVGLCLIATQISHDYTYIPSLFCLPPHFHPTFTTPGHDRATSWASCAIQQAPLALYYTHGGVYMSILLSQLTSPSPSPTNPHFPFFKRRLHRKIFLSKSTVWKGGERVTL